MEGGQSPSRSTLTLHPNAIATASPLQSYFNLHLESNTPPPDHTLLPNSQARTSPSAHTLPPSPPAGTCPPAHTHSLSLPYSPHFLRSSHPLPPTASLLSHISSVPAPQPTQSLPPLTHILPPSSLTHSPSLTCPFARRLLFSRGLGRSANQSSGRSRSSAASRFSRTISRTLMQAVCMLYKGAEGRGISWVWWS